MDEGNFDWSFLPRSLRDKLLPFQRKGVRFAIEKHGRCLIGDEMGLGKTLQAIAAAYYYHSEWPMLVVLPSSMKYPWIEELEKWLPCLQPNDINLIASSTDISNIPHASVSLVGYGLMQSSCKTLLEALHKQEFKVIIVDESHFLKNPKAARTKTLVPLLLKAKRVLMLSGTPALGRPAELFSQVCCLSRGQFGSWSNFARKYCNAQWKFYGRVRKWDTSGASNLNELHKKLTSTVMIRRQKKEVLTELPPKRRQKVPFELAESKQKKELDAMWEELGSYLKGEVKPEHGGDAGFEIKKLALNLFVSTGKAKIGAISEYVKMLLDNPEMKFLVFAHHKEVLAAIVQAVQSYAREKEPSLRYIRIDGDVPCMERMKDVSKFQQDPNVRVAALSIMAAGTGLTLTAASHVVFAELHWTPGVLEQCEDRAHRIGQVNAIHIHYLIAKGTIDEWMWSALNKKVGVLSSTLNGQLQKMNVEELGGSIGEFLKQAALCLPSKLDYEDDDSFFFSQTPKSRFRDIRSYMQQSQSSPKISPPRSTDTKEFFLPEIDNINEVDTLVCQEEVGDDVTDDNKHGIVGSKLKSMSYKEEMDQVGEQLDSKESSEVIEMKKGESKSFVSKDKKLPGTASVEDSIETDIPCYGQKISLERKLVARRDHQEKMDPVTTHTSVLPGVKDVLYGEKASCGSDVSDSDCEIIVGVTSSTGSIPQNHVPGSCYHVLSPFVEKCSKCHSAAKSVCSDQNDVEAGENQWSCPACTFLNHESLPLCEICDTPRKQERKKTRWVKRRMMSKKKKEKQKKTSQAMIVETISESDEDFEMLLRVSLESGTKSSKIDSSVKSNTERLKAREPLEIKDRICGAVQNVAHKSSGVSTLLSTKNEKLKKNKQERYWADELPQCSYMSDSETVLVSNQEGKGETTTAKQSFTDEEFQQKKDEKMKDASGLESRKEAVLTQEGIENEVKDVLECLVNSPSAPQTDIEPWTCSESSCGHVNTKSDVDCENCWASKPSKFCSSFGMFGSSKSPGFMPALDCFPWQRNDKTHNKHQSKILNYPIFKTTDRDTPFHSLTHGSCATDDSQLECNTEGIKNVVKTKQGNMLPPVEDSDRGEDMVIEPKIYESFLYCASKYTDRIYLYDEDQKPLHCTFTPLDLRICDTENLPSILQVKQNMKVAQRFLKEWDSLTEVKKRKIKKSGLIIDSPLAAVDALMRKCPFELSTRRFLTKDDLANAALKKAEEVGGSIRIIHKVNTRARLLRLPSSPNCQFMESPVAGRKRKDGIEGEVEDTGKRQVSNKKMKKKAESSLDSHGNYSFVQALNPDGNPLCVYCNGPIHNAAVSSNNAAWDTRYCSEQCKHENQVRWKTSKYVREQLLEVEGGICQICRLDAHHVFKTLRDLPKSQRKRYLCETPYACLSVKQLNDMISSPSEGQFWHADHIIPVYKGGGLCSLENFRTLCVLCHTRVTVEQGQERKKVRKEAATLKEGLTDIRKFLLDKG